MTEKKTWTASPITSDSPASLWATDSDALSAELISGGTIDDLARAANEHGIMITLTFIPATAEDEEPDA
jgi:hypothetical protein